ncbi:MAG: hypothetical protein AAGF12_14040 [Myxococcota bacterium]
MMSPTSNRRGSFLSALTLSRPSSLGRAASACSSFWLGRRSCLVVGFLCLASGLASCSNASAEERIELLPSDLPPSAGTDTRGVWQSVAWRGDPWQRIPENGTVVFPHDLGRIPRRVSVYLSFSQSGESAGLAAGNLGRITDVNDTTIAIKNDTNTRSLFCRLVAD